MFTRYGLNVSMLIADYDVTDHRDLALIAQASTLDCDEWGVVPALKEQAQHPSAVKVLDRIEGHLYHRQEWECGTL